MAPFAGSLEVTDLDLSSLELDARSTHIDNIVSDVSLTNMFKRDVSSAMSPAAENLHNLAARDNPSTNTPNHAGAVDPNDINMKGIQALFALIGASFVLAIIWFFFWAKNGGFKWRKGDWDDYKSTVLRRKGPNGTTLSNATKSTVLGGGSVVGEGYSDGNGSQWDGTVTDTMTETMTDLSSEAPIMKEKRRFRQREETAKERKMREVKEATWEGGHDQDVRAYMKERPARVGGINRDSDALHYGTDYTDTEGSAIHSVRTGRSQTQPQQQQQTTTVPPLRHVGSSTRQASPEKRQNRRDFSYTNEDSFSTISSSQPEMPAPTYMEAPPQAPPHRPGRYHTHSPSKQYGNDNNNYHRATTNPSQQQYALPPRQSNVPPGAYQESIVSDVQSQNTKSYHHPLPSLSAAHHAPAHPPQSQSPVRGGYRRDRRDSLE